MTAPTEVATRQELVEQMVRNEHDAALAERHRREVPELAGTLAARCCTSREAMLEKLGGDNAQRWKIASTMPAPSREPGTTHFERVENSNVPCRLVGPDEPDQDGSFNAATLAEIRDGFLAQKERLRVNRTAPDFVGPVSDAVLARERERLTAAGQERDEAIDRMLTGRLLDEIEHCGFSDEEQRLIRETLGSGNQRAAEELLIVRRAVTGPAGDLEPAWSLHQWTPEHGRPTSQELGSGSKVVNLSELRDEVRARARIFERYGGQHAVAAWPALRAPAI